MDTHACSLDALSTATVPNMEDVFLAELIDDFYAIVFDDQKPSVQNMSRDDMIELVTTMIVTHREHAVLWKIECDSLYS